MPRPRQSAALLLLSAVIIPMLTLLGVALSTGGCRSTATAGSTTQPATAAPTQADMVRIATQSERALTIVERGLNEAFERKVIPASVHPTLSPYVHAARDAVTSMSDAAVRGDTPSWQSGYNAFMAAMPALLDVQTKATTKTITTPAR